ncbi:MAG: NYN domain-containing protein [Aureliella sp.]
MSVRFLIDGYNLLHATGAMPGQRGAEGGSRRPGRGELTLAQARERLLRQLAAGLTPDQRLATQVVFDAGRSSPRGESEVVSHGLTVTYAVGFLEADDLLEQISRQHPQPQRLTVVSSDLRIQRTAKSRKARVVNCDQWLMELLDRGSQQTSSGHEADSAPPASVAQALESPEPPEALRGPPTADEVARWMDEFGFRS